MRSCDTMRQLYANTPSARHLPAALFASPDAPRVSASTTIYASQPTHSGLRTNSVAAAASLRRSSDGLPTAVTPRTSPSKFQVFLQHSDFGPSCDHYANTTSSHPSQVLLQAPPSASTELHAMAALADTINAGNDTPSGVDHPVISSEYPAPHQALSRAFVSSTGDFVEAAVNSGSDVHVLTFEDANGTRPDTTASGLPAPDTAGGGAPPPSARSAAERATDDVLPNVRRQPLSAKSVRAERDRQAAQQSVMLRPLRLLPVGKEVRFTPEDQAFLRYAETANIPISFLSPCPKSGASAKRYLRYMPAKTLRQAQVLGASREDLKWDYCRGYIKFPRHEPQLPGHVFNALASAREHGYTHVLEELGMSYVDPVTHEVLLGRAFNARGSTTFQHVLETVFEPEVLLQEFENRELSVRWAEFQASKVFNSSTVKLDLSLAPEPQHYRDVMPEVCDEHQEWKDAMDLEMLSMAKFGVFERVPKSRARGRQILGNKWVYRRKIGKDGTVTRWRARLVAQGFRQRPFDSYQPDECYSPTLTNLMNVTLRW